MPNVGEQKIEIRLPQGLQPIYWGALGIGGLLMLMGFENKEYGYLIAACFFGIVARIIQAEHHVRVTAGLKSIAMAPNPAVERTDTAKSAAPPLT